MRGGFLAVLTLAAACARGPEFARHEDPAGGFSAEVPSRWRRDGDKDLSRRPVAVVSFIGAVDAQDESVPLGAVIHVTRVSRLPSDQPAGGRRQAFIDAWITPTEVLFGASKDALKPELRAAVPARIDPASLGGRPARTYQRDYVHNNPIHMSAPVPMRLVDFVVKTDAAYFIVEYRATLKRFDEFHPAFERFLKTFAFGPKA